MMVLCQSGAARREKLKNRRIAENVLPLGNDTYGALHWNSVELANMYYEAGEQKWIVVSKRAGDTAKA